MPDTIPGPFKRIENISLELTKLLIDRVNPATPQTELLQIVYAHLAFILGTLLLEKNLCVCMCYKCSTRNEK